MYRRFDTAGSFAGLPTGQNQFGKAVAVPASGFQGNSNRQNGGGQQLSQHAANHSAPPSHAGHMSAASTNRQAERNPQGRQNSPNNHGGMPRVSDNKAAGQGEEINRVKTAGSALPGQNPRQGGMEGSRGQQRQKNEWQNAKRPQEKPKTNFLKGLLPSSVYDPKSKKIFGFLSAEDLLLVALIFLFLEKDDGDNTVMVLALIYVLISDYIDLPDFAL